MVPMETKVIKADEKSYKKVINAFKSRRTGATPADIAAATGLPLNTVRELVPRAADEYSGRLEVTESGEILYSFPKGYNSRYRGFIPFVRRAADTLIRTSISAGTLIFKIWIMVMLIGYFLLFMAIALASVFLSAAASSSGKGSRRGRGNVNFSFGIFNLIFRLWFYSEMTRSFNSPYRSAGLQKPKSRPLHRAIFSFVFGDPDPNADFRDQEKRTFIDYLQEHKGIISLPEFMTLTGLKPDEADRAITSYCVEFSGSPEATEEGTVVYRFDEILLRSDEKSRTGKTGLPLLLKKMESFSSNPGKMNWWFALINGVNLIFGSYFLYNVSAIGHILPGKIQGIYGYVYYYLSYFGNPLPVIFLGLGIVPVVFSFLFWLVPLLRHFFLKDKNEKLRFENFRKFSYGKIWDSPLFITKTDLNPVNKEAGPSNPNEVPQDQDKVLMEMGTYAIPEITLDDRKNEVYCFAELNREKEALEKYRSTVNPASLGNTVFDSEA